MLMKTMESMVIKAEPGKLYHSEQTVNIVDSNDVRTINTVRHITFSFSHKYPSYTQAHRNIDK